MITKNKLSLISLTVLFAMVMAMTLTGTALAENQKPPEPVTGAVFTTVNPDVDGTGRCENGGPGADAGLVNCNIYTGKNYVWLSGGPEGNQPALGDGSYFFAVLVPGGQGGNENPNDGTDNNLSDLTPTSNTGAGDEWTNRIFTVSGGVVSYSGTHDFSKIADSQSQYGKIRLMPYDDTTNPGGEYILAVCKVPAAITETNQPGVVPSDCKYDAFKVKTGTPAPELDVTKTATPSYDLTYTWSIDKSVDNTLVKQSDIETTFTYTVVVGHDSGKASNWKLAGTITVTNPNGFDIAGVNVTDTVSNNGVCEVTEGTGITVPGKGSVVLNYTCSYEGEPNPPVGTNTAMASWFEGYYYHTGTASFDFNAITPMLIDDSVTVTDTMAGFLGTVQATDASPTIFTYEKEVTGTPGTCTDFNNTATFATNTTKTTGSDDQLATLCVGADLKVNKTAIPTFTRTYGWDISKAVVPTTTVKKVGGTATFNYTVNVWQTGFTDSNWAATGTITVTNPNKWEDITTNVSDVVDNGGSCVLKNSLTEITVPASGSVDVDYSCTFTSGASGTNKATASWDKVAYYTPSGLASGTATIAFVTPTTTVNKTITVTDTFNGTTTTLGTLTASDGMPFAEATYTYPRSVAVPTWECKEYSNTATIVETDQSASQTVKICGPTHTGALTMGFWQNKNGQAIITGQAKTGVCPSTTWLRGYAPFQDLSATATCSQVGAYVTTVIKAANASGSSMNAMLKAQMLATSLDVYFSDPALGGNKINAPAPIGGVSIDLTLICTDMSCTSFEDSSSVFGGTPMTILEMLKNAAANSNAAGTMWYGNVKSTQELAKDAFDAINNQKVFSSSEKLATSGDAYPSSLPSEFGQVTIFLPTLPR